MNDMRTAGNLSFTHDLSEVAAIFLDFEIYKGRRFQLEWKLD